MKITKKDLDKDNFYKEDSIETDEEIELEEELGYVKFKKYVKRRCTFREGKKEMKDCIYLIFDKFGVNAMRKTLPELKAGQYATRLDVVVDDKYFKRIVPIAKMELDDKFLIEPKIILEPVEKPEDMPQGEEVTA